jgi:surface antigen
LPACSAALALVAGGCSYRMEALNTRAHSTDAELTTGSITPRAQALPPAQPTAAMPAERDLAAARAAVSEALAGGGRHSVPWEDARTGARGTVTPLSSAHTEDGSTCRDFLASYVRNGSESWLQGEACRGQQGRWEVRQMRPWRRT